MSISNWKTTLIGIGGSLALGAGSILQTGTIPDTKTWISMIVTALLGWFAKDYNVTGGTVPQ